MTSLSLPQGLIPKGSSPTFTEETLPDAIRNDHALGPGRWGVLQLLEGEITYVDLVAGEEHALKAPALMAIAPESPHKVRPGDDPFRFRVDFFVEGEGEPKKPDLGCPEQIRVLVVKFYERVRQDELLRPVFVDQAQVDWNEHVPKLTAFWCKLELGIPGYQGAPTQKHSILSRSAPFRAEQFARWVALFHSTIDEGWRGPHADSIKDQAVRIAKAQSLVVHNAEPWEHG